jgi:lipoprotein-anchoring transpeptidase ErfK/SrfK
MIPVVGQEERMVRKALVFATTIAASLVLATGCGSDDSDGTGAQAPSVPVSSVPVSSVPVSQPPPVSAPASPPASAGPAPGVGPTATPAPAKPRKLKVGAKGADVRAVQQRLLELGYWLAKPDGKFGGTTQQAVFALQKAAGIGRDGTIGPKTRKALDAGVRPKAKSKPGSGYLVEINLKRQLMMLVRDGNVVTTLNTSTGSNEYYEHDGATHLADTPTGRFKVSRQINGMRISPLGELWRPKYFNGGIAMHGSPSIPPYAASHGCARLSNAAINWIWSTNKVPLKTKVWVYRS